MVSGTFEMKVRSRLDNCKVWYSAPTSSSNGYKGETLFTVALHREMEDGHWSSLLFPTRSTYFEFNSKVDCLEEKTSVGQDDD